MSTEKQSSGSPIPNIIAGVVLVGAGGFVHTALAGNEAIEKLAKQGIPLDLGATVSTIGVFLILFPIIKSFFVAPLAQAINERNQNLERTFSETEELRSELQRMKADYEQKLVQAEAEAREQIQAQIKEAQNLRQTLMAEAAERADALIERAHQEIASERDRVINELRTQVVDLALTAAERVIGENMNNDRNRALVANFINTVEVAR